MRPELHKYEVVEQYLTNSLSAEDLSAFKAELAVSSDLQGQVEFQSLMIQKSKRAALQAQIAMVASSTPPPRGKGKGKWIWGSAIVFVIGAIAALLFNTSNETIQETLPIHVENEHVVLDSIPETKPEEPFVALAYKAPRAFSMAKLVLDTNFRLATTSQKTNTETGIEKTELDSWVTMERQRFGFKGKNGTTLVGKQGTLVVIPSDAFVDENGNVVDGFMTIELIEALHWEDMFLYNLTTTADGKQLNSGGMLKIQGMCNGKKVEINPERPLYIEIPTDNYDPNMQSWEGKITNGKVNWTNPTPLKRYLTLVDLNLLDFVPEGFDKVVEKGLPIDGQDKLTVDLVDSLYYSISPLLNMQVHDRGGFGLTMWSMKDKKKKISDSPFTMSNDTSSCFIDPVDIMTIKTKEFAKTFIATREFEERLRAIHKMDASQKYLNIYLNNLDKDMHFSDSVNARNSYGDDKAKFDVFASQNVGNVEGNIYQNQLKAHFKAEREEMRKALGMKKPLNREDLESKLKEVKKKRAKGIGLTRGASRARISKKPVYSLTWNKSSWLNIDAYLHLVEKGNKVEVGIDVGASHNAATIYQSIGFLNTAVTLNVDGGFATGVFPDPKLNESLTMINSYVVGIYKEKDVIFYAGEKFNPYRTEEVKLTWVRVSEEDLPQKLFSISPEADEMLIDLDGTREVFEMAIKVDENMRKNPKKKSGFFKRRRDKRYFNYSLVRFVRSCENEEILKD